MFKLCQKCVFFSQEICHCRASAGSKKYKDGLRLLLSSLDRTHLKVCSCCSHFGLGHNNCAPLGPLSALFGRMFWNFIIASWTLSRIILEMWGWRVLTKRFTNPDESTFSSSSRIVVWEGTSADPPPSVKTGITQFTQVLQLFSICLRCDKYQRDKIWSDVAKVFLTSLPTPSP